MLRAAASLLLIMFVLAESLAAQRGGTAFHGSAAGPQFHSSVHSSGRPTTRAPFIHGGFHHNRSAVFFPYWLPYDAFDGYEETYVENAPPEPPPMIIQSREPDRPPVQAQVIEIPPSPNRGPVKPLPPAVFILRNGERLQAERFLLRMSAVSVTVNRQQRIIPFDLLDLDATLAINRDRGIDLRIPSDPSEITLSF